MLSHSQGSPNSQTHRTREQNRGHQQPRGAGGEGGGHISERIQDFSCAMSKLEICSVQLGPVVSNTHCASFGERQTLC